MDRLTLTPSLYAEMVRTIRKRRDDRTYSLLSGNPPYSGLNTFHGVPIQSSNVFPHQHQCGTCRGTGEGIESTYCDRCGGAGQIRLVGMMQNQGQTILIRDKLPKAFAPYFPAGLVAMPPLSRGWSIREVDHG